MSAQPIVRNEGPTPERRALLAKRARLLAGGSVAYNVVEGLVGLTAGSVAGSAALISFGLDSAVEVASGLVILWQFRHPLPESRERLAQRLVAACFVALAAYVTYDSVASLVTREHAGVSVVGIVLAAVSLVVMPLIAWGKRRTGRELDSSAVVADSVQTLLCTYLSAILLVGLLGNLVLGWWWLDSVAALAIAVIALREGVETWRGDED